MIQIEEEITQRSIAITVKAGKLTGRALLAVLRKAVDITQNRYQAHLAPDGKQTVKQLMNHRQATNTMPLSGDTQLFDQVARKWKVDYAIHKVGKDKYTVLFRGAQADAMEAVLGDYAKKLARRRQTPSIIKQLQNIQAKIAARTAKHKERTRTREAVHGDR